MQSAGGRAHHLDVVRMILISCLVLYHNLRIFQGPVNHNQIVIRPSAEWQKDRDTMDYVELTWKYIAKTQRAILQEGLNLFFMLAGCAAYLSLVGRKNIMSFMGERFNKLLLAFIFGVIFLALPSNYFIHEIKAAKKGLPGESFFSFLTQGKAYEPGHLLFLPYLFLVTTVMTPIFLFAVRVKNRSNSDNSYSISKRDDDASVTLEIVNNNNTNNNNNNNNTHNSELEKEMDIVTVSWAGSDDAPSNGTRAVRVGEADEKDKTYLLTASFAIHGLVYSWWALTVDNPSMWALSVFCAGMVVWILHSQSSFVTFQDKLQDISKSHLCVAFLVIPLLVYYINGKGEPFFLHPFGLCLFFLVLLVLPLLPIRAEFPWPLSDWWVHFPIVALLLLMVSQLICLTYPERLLRSSNIFIDVNPLSWFLSTEIAISERTLYSWAYMLIGHTAMFAAGFVKMCYEGDWPPIPWGTLFNYGLCMSFILVAGPQMTNSAPEGWEFLNPGYVAYDFDRFARMMYSAGGWWWVWLCVLIARAGTNEFPRRPWMTWLRDCSFGIFFCHVFWEALISYWLVVNSWASEWNWFFKIAFLNVTVYLGCFLWCWVVLRIPFVRLLCGMKPPQVAKGEESTETKLLKKWGFAKKQQPQQQQQQQHLQHPLSPRRTYVGQYAV